MGGGGRGGGGGGELSVKIESMSGQDLGFCSRGGKIAVFAYQGGQALHAVQYNIYIVKFQGGGGKHPARGGRMPPPPLNETLHVMRHEGRKKVSTDLEMSHEH